MHRYLSLLLIFGLASGEENLDKLVYKKGAVYTGTFLGIDNNKLRFTKVDGSVLTPILKTIKQLSINNGLVIDDGRWIVNRNYYIIPVGEKTYDKSMLSDAEKELLSKEEEQKRKELVCNNNSKVKVTMLPFKNDLYGITEDFYGEMVDYCYDMQSLIDGLEYLDKKELNIENVTDFHLLEIGKLNSSDFVAYGYTYKIEVPFKANPTSTALDYFKELNPISPLASDIFKVQNQLSIWDQLPLIITQAQENLALNNAKSASGTYVLITYFMIDVKSGKRTYLLKNNFIKKLG